MSDLTHGLAPKMKPSRGRRSAIVVRARHRTSKIVCAIARLKPRRRRTWAAAPHLIDRPARSRHSQARA
jgi:hypothetical protein